MIMLRFCVEDLGFNETFCDDKDSDAYEDIAEDDVQVSII